MKEILNELFTYNTLSKEEARHALVEIAEERINQSQLASFLTVFNMRAITVDELEGFRDALLEMCIRVDLTGYDGMDMCGTGGDGKNTFNISTLSAFVVAAAGQNIIKHGNNGVSSVCGSSNLLNYFGYQFTSEEENLKRSLDSAGICFLHAPLFHPAMKNIAPVRKELATKTFFNMLGPMVNPAFPEKQLVGVFNLELARLYGYLYQNSQKQFVILHSLDGYDEISLTDNFKLIDSAGERIVDPVKIGLRKVTANSISGGNSIKDSARIFESIIKGEGTNEQNEVVIANAGMALYYGMGLHSIEDGIGLARQSLASGQAYKCFKNFLRPEKKTIKLS